MNKRYKRNINTSLLVITIIMLGMAVVLELSSELVNMMPRAKSRRDSKFVYDMKQSNRGLAALINNGHLRIHKSNDLRLKPNTELSLRFKPLTKNQPIILWQQKRNNYPYALITVYAHDVSLTGEVSVVYLVKIGQTVVKVNHQVPVAEFYQWHDLNVNINENGRIDLIVDGVLTDHDQHNFIDSMFKKSEWLFGAEYLSDYQTLFSSEDNKVYAHHSQFYLDDVHFNEIDNSGEKNEILSYNFKPEFNVYSQKGVEMMIEFLDQQQYFDNQAQNQYHGVYVHSSGPYYDVDLNSDACVDNEEYRLITAQILQKVDEHDNFDVKADVNQDQNIDYDDLELVKYMAKTLGCE